MQILIIATWVATNILITFLRNVITISIFDINGSLHLEQFLSIRRSSK
jgi:hypothetical protein